jgi:hypothetical protein
VSAWRSGWVTVRGARNGPAPSPPLPARVDERLLHRWQPSSISLLWSFAPGTLAQREQIRQADCMTAQFSIYLDLLRFTAALWVVVAHLQNWGVARWLPDLSGRDAVVIFFVLSGLVITHAAQGRTFRQYAVARLARIYSVALPIILIAIIVDWQGAFYDRISILCINMRSCGSTYHFI